MRVALILLLLGAAALRLWDLGENPPGFFCDEASFALEGRSVLKTGRDLTGEWFPWVFHAFGDGKSGVLAYPAGLSVSLFGVNEVAARLPVALFGIASVLVVYFLGMELFGAMAGLAAAAVFAVAPWHVHLSRPGFDVMMEIFWLSVFLLAVVRARTSRRAWPYVVVSAWLAFFSYAGARFHTFALVVICGIAFFPELVQTFRGRHARRATAVAVVLFAGIAWLSLNGKLFNRWDQVKGDANLAAMPQGWLAHFSPTYLFLKGETSYPGAYILRHSWFDVGMLPWFVLALLVAALVLGFRDKLDARTRRALVALVVFAVLVPIPAALLTRVPHSIRSAALLLPIALLAGFGAERIWARRSWRPYAAVLLGVGVVLATLTDVRALNDYKLKGGGHMGWQYGYRSAVEEARRLAPYYDRIYITHRYNRGETLLRFFTEEKPCEKCSVQRNPIVIHPEHRELFFVRREDREEALRLYPELEFQRLGEIVRPDGVTELEYGQFQAARRVP